MFAKRNCENTEQLQQKNNSVNKNFVLDVLILKRYDDSVTAINEVKFAGKRSARQSCMTRRRSKTLRFPGRREELQMDRFSGDTR